MLRTRLHADKYSVAALLIWAAPLSSIFSQHLPDKKISIAVSDQPLVKVLDLVQQKSGVALAYNPKKIAAEKTITYRSDNKSIQIVLNDLAALGGFEYSIVEGQVVLRPQKKTEKAAQAPNSTFSGYVRDSRSGEALIGATVYIKELQTGTTTNPFGFFSLTIPKGAYVASISYVGYDDISQQVDLSHSVLQNLSMKESVSQLEEVVVTTDPGDALSNLSVGTNDLTTATVEEHPSYLGEMDVVKSLESLPGLKLHSDGSTFYYVRGGNRDQNLMLIDDAPVYNPSHLLGFFSTIIPDAVNDITLYKGDMPASMGGRLSSVLDIRTKKGNDQHFRAWGNTGIISTKVGVEGPLKKDASSYLLSFRVSRLKWILNAFNADIDKFNFYDLTAKVNVRVNPKNRFFFSLYNGGDHYFDNRYGISWTNTAFSVKWNRLITDRIFLNTTLAAGGYDYFLFTDVTNNTRWTSHIANFNLKNDLTYFIRPENEITMGMGFNAHGFNPGNIQSDAGVPSLPSLSVRNSLEFVLYGSHSLKLTDRWKLSYGLRFTSWTNTGDAFEFVYDDSRNPVDTLYFEKGQSYQTYRRLEPRLALSYQLDPVSSIKVSASRNVQNVHLISNSISPFTSLEVWLPSSINIRPQTANQATLGYYRDGIMKSTNLTAEVYYKKMYDQIDYESHAETLLNPLLESELRFGTGTAYGLELTAKKEEGRVRGLVGYTYSRSTRKFSEINDGQSFNTFYDRPHQVNVQLTYDLTPRWSTGMNWIYSTGAPYSAPVSFFHYQGQQVPVYGQKNNARLPDYHRLDLSANYRLNRNTEKKFQHNLSFSIYNFYGRKNILFVNYNKISTNDGLKMPSDLTTQNRVMSQFYLYSFTPSISYNFKWL